MKLKIWSFAALTFSVAIVLFTAASLAAKAQLSTRPTIPGESAITGLPTVATAPLVVSTPTPTPVPTPTPLPPRKATYNKCHVAGSEIAMTFDDGPHPKLTPMLLDIMKARGIKGTFFLVGKNVAEYPEIAQRIVAEGHEVANHSWAHPQLTRLAPDALKKEIADTNDAIHRATGIQTTLMRPPYGAINASITKRLNEEFGLTVALWSVDSLDWKIRNAAHVTKLITEKTAPGAIILAHDIHPSTVQAMPAVFDTLSAKGYKFVTMSELIALDLPAPIQTAPANTPAGIPTPPTAGIPAATPAGPPIATPAPSLAPRTTPATTTP